MKDPKDAREGALDMLGGGTLVDGIYWAADSEKLNKHIKMIEETGLPGCVQLCDDTPDWVINFLVREANSWHEGSAWTLVEAYDDCIKGEAAFKAFAKKSGITTDSCPRSGPFRYEKRYEEFIFKMYDPKYFFKTWDMFSAMKAFRHEMDKLDLWQRYQQELDEKADYLHQQINNEAIAANNHCLLTEWAKFAPAHDEGLAKETMREHMQLYINSSTNLKTYS